MPLLGSIILKVIIYSLWCYIAIRYLPKKHYKINHSNKFKSALKFGVIRITIGLIVGIPIWYFSSLIFPNDYSSRLGMSLPVALSILIFIHFISWCIILRFMLGQILAKIKEIFWIVGGMLISCLMDIILLISFQFVFTIC